uniref:Uncharacterized protein n=1 Tax=Knipowitschia caucasica TaxID=637954 RepID=A0AAV2MJA6_KNICA
MSVFQPGRKPLCPYMELPVLTQLFLVLASVLTTSDPSEHKHRRPSNSEAASSDTLQSEWSASTDAINKINGAQMSWRPCALLPIVLIFTLISAGQGAAWTPAEGRSSVPGHSGAWRGTTVLMMAVCSCCVLWHVEMQRWRQRCERVARHLGEDHHGNWP